MEVLTLYPAPNPTDGTNKAEWTPTEPLKRGEYDLVNISLIGFDPNTGWTYDQCHAAWKRAVQALEIEERNLRWWDWAGRLRVNRKVAALSQRHGAIGFL